MRQPGARQAAHAQGVGLRAHLELVEEVVLVDVGGGADGLAHGLLDLFHLVCLVVDLVQDLQQRGFRSLKA